MILRDRHDGAAFPFEGDRELVLRHLPADARVLHARATVIPVASESGDGEPFVETVDFEDGIGSWGATKSKAAGWVEVDFHARRTVVGLAGSFSDAAVQADLGGGFVALGESGGFRAENETALTVPGPAAVVPSFTASRLRLVASGTPDVTSVRVRSAPAGVRLALAGQPALWFHAGELTRAATTPDFGVLLQAYLDDAGEVEDGVWRLPFVLHSDALCRLSLEVEIEYLRRAVVLPGEVPDIALSFDHGGLAAGGGGLAATLPPDARVAAGAGRLSGAFDETRVAFGPRGAVSPAGDLSVAADSTPAQPVVLPAAVEAVAVDLLLASRTRTARLQLDLRLDLDGKPSGESMLAAPVPFALDREIAARPTWVSVPLAAPLQLRAETTGWLVVQGLEGEAAWSAEAAPADGPAVQLTRDGGFSWRRAALAGAPAAAFFRLRTRPADFRMPIDLWVGASDAARRVDLSRFEAQKRLDLRLDLPEIAGAFNDALAAGAGRCPEAEHLDNGGFDRWVRTGNELGPAAEVLLGVTWPRARLALTPDGGSALVAGDENGDVMHAVLVDLDQGAVVHRFEEGGGGRVVAVLAAPSGERGWVVLEGAVWVLDLARRRPVGQPVLFEAMAEGGLSGAVSAALDGGGERLLVALAPGEPAGRVVALDVRRLEDAARRGGQTTAAAEVGGVDLSVSAPAALASPPGGGLIEVLAATVGTPAVLSAIEAVPLEAATLEARDDRVEALGPGSPRALGLMPDGGRMVLLEDRLLLPGGKEVILENQAAEALAMDLDGSRAFVAGASGLTVVDVRRRSAAPLLLGTHASDDAVPASDVALSAAGDRLVAVLPSAGQVVTIPVGSVAPAAWTVTAGRVQRWSVGEGPLALLGEIAVDPASVGKASSAEAPRVVQAATAALSQVVPVAAGCAYELSFVARASEPDAVAEVIWRAGDCGAVRTDSVAIAAFDRSDLAATRTLVAHRVRLAAPASAVQAEVRLRAPAGVVAVFDSVSFRATAAALRNGELAGSGLPAPWTLSPQPAAGFTALSHGDVLRLRNDGLDEVAVVQEVEVGPGPDFTLEVRARSVPGGPAARVELRWLPDGPLAGWRLPAEGFDVLSVRGSAAVGAVAAELRLVLPPGAAMDVAGVDLRFTGATPVPVTFVAQAPGELAVVGWELLYDQVPAARPVAPPAGLCPPGRPPRVAGERGENGECCHHEAAKAVAASPSAAAAMETLAGRASAPSTAAITELPHIGKGRCRMLREAGMDRMDVLARVSPTVLQEVLRISRDVAVEIVLAARRRLRDQAAQA